MKDLDAIAEAWLLGFLADEGNYAMLMPGADDDSELRQVRAQLEKARGENDALFREVAADKKTSALALQLEQYFASEIARLEERERELTTPATLAWLLAPHGDVTRRWDSAPLALQREAAKIVFTREFAGTIYVLPAGRGAVPLEDQVILSSEPPNAAHVTLAGRRERAAAELAADATRPGRALAKVCGTSPWLCWKVRGELVERHVIRRYVFLGTGGEAAGVHSPQCWCRRPDTPEVCE